jgi:hypothetical protein
LLIEAVKSQQAEIQQLKAQVVQLQAHGVRDGQPAPGETNRLSQFQF